MAEPGQLSSRWEAKPEPGPARLLLPPTSARLAGVERFVSRDRGCSAVKPVQYQLPESYTTLPVSLPVPGPCRATARFLIIPFFKLPPRKSKASWPFGKGLAPSQPRLRSPNKPLASSAALTHQAQLQAAGSATQPGAGGDPKTAPAGKGKGMKYPPYTPVRAPWNNCGSSPGPRRH